MKAVPTYWSSFIPGIYHDLRSRVNQTVDGVFMTQQAMELTLLEFLTIVPEELGRVEIEPVRKYEPCSFRSDSCWQATTIVRGINAPLSAS